MTAHDDVVALERAGWVALAAGGADATAFYERVLGERVTMLLPGGMALTDRAQALASMGGPAWTSYALEEMHVLEPAPGTAFVHYGVVATRDDVEYSALIGSLYVRGADGWRLVAHQQTPR